MRYTLGIFLFFVIGSAGADPITWTLNDVVFGQEATASGSFNYDATTDTYSNINIVTTVNPAYGGDTYTTLGGPSSSATLLGLSGTANPFAVLTLEFVDPLTNSGGVINLRPGGGNIPSVEIDPISGSFRGITAGRVSAFPNPSTVTIDFDGATGGFGSNVQVPQGFIFSSATPWTGTTQTAGFCPVSPGPPAVGNFYCAFQAAVSYVATDFEQTDGLTFDLLEMEVFLVDTECAPGFNCIGDEAKIQAWDADNNLIAEMSIFYSVLGSNWATVQFDATWTNISRVTYTAQEELSSEAGSYVYLDNIKVDVRIPAEVDVIGEVHPHHVGNGGLPDDTVPVAVMGASTLLGDPVDLDVSLIDPASVRFGPNKASIDPASTPNLNYNHDGDGTPDARLAFKMSDIGFPYTPGSGFPCSASPAELSGELTTGEKFAGADTTVTAACAAVCH